MQRIDSKSWVNHFEIDLRSLLSLNTRWMSALPLLILIALPVQAQFGSSLSGTVLDSTGAAIPHASTTLTNTGTQQSQTSITNATGAYHFSELAPGQYSLVVTATGFKKSDLTQVAIEAESPRTLDVTLQTGGATESVEVTADQILLLQTSDASVGTTIDSEEIEKLPTYGADPYEVLRTAPGITGMARAAAPVRHSFCRMAPVPAAPTPASFKRKTRFRFPRMANARPTTTS